MTEDSRKVAAFEDLEVFKRAYRLSLELHRLSLGWPGVEQTGLGDQVRRASKGICANLAEGWGRRGSAPADCRRYLQLAIGSADEMRVWLRYALDLGYLDEPRWQEFRQGYHEVARMLVGLRQALLG